MRAWQEMSHEEFTEELQAGRDEARRRIQQMAALLGMDQPSGKPGRPPKNAYRYAGEGQDSETDDANGAAS